MAAARSGNSDMLFGVRRSLVPLILAFAACLAVFATPGISQQNATPSAQQPAEQQSGGASQQPSAGSTPLGGAPTQSLPLPQTSTAEPVRYGPMIVINPAHGGTDTGARGENGLTEKEQVLILARMLRSDLERNGFHAILTRNDDSNPSYEDRAAVANAYRDAIFVSLHVASTGKFGTLRAYSYEAVAPGATAEDENPAAPRLPNGLVPWEQAQQPHVDASKRLADLLQSQFVIKFSGSPQSAAQYAVRDLRSVNAPAVAVEVSSVAVPDPNSLLALGSPLSIAVVRSLQLFRPAPVVPAPAAPAIPPAQVPSGAPGPGGAQP
jgi:N-acetylmuramoyl-L-alanine amidase